MLLSLHLFSFVTCRRSYMFSRLLLQFFLVERSRSLSGQSGVVGGWLLSWAYIRGWTRGHIPLPRLFVVEGS